MTKRKKPKFIQIAAGNEYLRATLLALDTEGQIWCLRPYTHMEGNIGTHRREWVQLNEPFKYPKKEEPC